MTVSADELFMQCCLSLSWWKVSHFYMVSITCPFTLRVKFQWINNYPTQNTTQHFVYHWDQIPFPMFTFFNKFYSDDAENSDSVMPTVERSLNYSHSIWEISQIEYQMYLKSLYVHQNQEPIASCQWQKHDHQADHRTNYQAGHCWRLKWNITRGWEL